jgi:peptidyl-prolyl cis-trans isomerase D
LNSSVLEVGENHAIVLRTLDHQEEEPKPLEEVSEDIVSLLQNERATEQLNELAESLESELAGGDAAAVAEANGGEYVEVGAVGRNNPDLDRLISRSLFQLPKPSEGSSTYESVTTTDGNIALIIFNGIESAESEDDTTAEEEAPKGTAAAASSEFQAMIATLEESAKIERNEALLSSPAY